MSNEENEILDLYDVRTKSTKWLHEFVSRKENKSDANWVRYWHELIVRAEGRKNDE